MANLESKLILLCLNIGKKPHLLYTVVKLTTVAMQAIIIMANIPFSLRLDADVKSKLKYEAQQLNRSESFVAAMAIRRYLAACEQKRKAIDIAVKQADQGAFISSDAMGAWVDSWGSDKELDLPAADVNIKR